MIVINQGHGFTQIRPGNEVGMEDLKMSDTAQLITAFSGLTVAVGALLISIGVLYLVMKLGNAIEALGDGEADE